MGMDCHGHGLMDCLNILLANNVSCNHFKESAIVCWIFHNVTIIRVLPLRMMGAQWLSGKECLTLD